MVHQLNFIGELFDRLTKRGQPEVLAEAAIVAKSGARTVPIVTVTDDAGDERVASIGWNPGALDRGEGGHEWKE